MASEEKQAKKAPRRVALRRAGMINRQAQSDAAAAAGVGGGKATATRKKKTYANIEEVWQDFKKTGEKHLRKRNCEGPQPKLRFIPPAQASCAGLRG